MSIKYTITNNGDYYFRLAVNAFIFCLFVNRLVNMHKWRDIWGVLLLALIVVFLFSEFFKMVLIEYDDEALYLKKLNRGMIVLQKDVIRLKRLIGLMSRSGGLSVGYSLEYFDSNRKKTEVKFLTSKSDELARLKALLVQNNPGVIIEEA